jgi:hypothetical protein
MTVLSNDPTAEMGPRYKRQASFKAQGVGLNKHTPSSYEDPYFGAGGGADVDFVVHNIVDDANRFGTPIFEVQWQQLLGRDHQKIEDTWEPLENIKGCDLPTAFGEPLAEAIAEDRSSRTPRIAKAGAAKIDCREGE